MKTFFFSKKFIGIVLLVAVIQLLLSYGSFGPAATMNAKNVPIGIVSEDEGNAAIHLGEEIQKNITDQKMPQVNWIRFSTKSDMDEAMNNKELYGGLVIPKNFTEAVSSFPKEAQSSVLMVVVNQGMSQAGSQMAETIMTSTASAVKEKLRANILNKLQAQDTLLSSAEIIAFDKLIQNEVVHVNATGSPFNGQLPIVLTTLLWMGSLIGALLTWLGLHRKGQNVKSFLSLQLLGGLVIAVAQSGFIVLIIDVLLGQTLANYALLIPFLLLTSVMFYLIQVNVLNWLGFKGWPLLVLVWLFGPAIVNLPPEFLSAGYRVGIYSWIPIRFNVEGFKSILFFEGNADLLRMVLITSLISAAGLGMLLLSSLRLKKNNLEESPMNRRTAQHEA